MADIHLIQLQTERFRESLDPLWVRIRHLLIERDLDPPSMVLACFEPEDIKFRFGILASEDGRVFQFGFDFTGTKSPEGRFSEWEEFTGNWEKSAFRRHVADACRLLEREKGRNGKDNGPRAR